MTRHGIARIAREVFLTFGAVLGVVCILVTAAGFAFGVKPLIFRSGSMSPAIHTGDMAISRTVEASALKRGDIVSVKTSGGQRVTHRLVNAARQGHARQLTLKGDANKKADTEVYTVTRAERVVFTIPKAGYVVNAATSPAGVFVLGLYVAAMVTLIFRRPRGGGPDESEPAPGGRRGGKRRANRPGRSRSVVRTAAPLVTAAMLTIASPAVAAPWTDAVAVTGTTMTAYTLPAPVVSCGALGLGSVTIHWTAVTGATGYVLHYGTGGATSQTVSSSTLSKTFSGVATSGTFTVQAERNFGSVTWTSAASNSKNYSVVLAVLGTCT